MNNSQFSFSAYACPIGSLINNPLTPKMHVHGKTKTGEDSQGGDPVLLPSSARAGERPGLPPRLSSPVCSFFFHLYGSHIKVSLQDVNPLMPEMAAYLKKKPLFIFSLCVHLMRQWVKYLDRTAYLHN